MDTITQAAQAVATKAAGVSGMRGTSAFPVDTIPATPYTVVGPSTGTLLQGSWEGRTITFPMRCYVARLSSTDRDGSTVNTLIENMVIAFRSGITDSAGVHEIAITNWQSGLYETVGTEDYQVVDFQVRVTIFQGVTYTA